MPVKMWIVGTSISWSTSPVATSHTRSFCCAMQARRWPDGLKANCGLKSPAGTARRATTSRAATSKRPTPPASQKAMKRRSGESAGTPLTGSRQTGSSSGKRHTASSPLPAVAKDSPSRNRAQPMSREAPPACG